MIKINLAPEEELEDKLWWLPMVLGAVFVFAGTYFVVDHYHEQIRIETIAINDEAAENQRGFEELRPKSQEYKARSEEKRDLENRLAALSRITESKILRYRPVILLEHLQNLKPEGIWFRTVNLLKTRQDAPEEPAPAPGVPTGQTGDEVAAQAAQARINTEADMHEIVIEGSAFDNILVAEFLSALKSTQTQEVDPTALRTMVYFSDVKLEQTTSGTEELVTFGQMQNQGNQAQFPNVAGNVQGANTQAQPINAPVRQTVGEEVTVFKIVLKFREHAASVRSPRMQTFSFRPDFNKKFTMY